MTPATKQDYRRPKSLTRSALGTFGTNVATATLSLTQVLIVARVLGPTGRGQIVFLITVATLTSELASLSMFEANANIGGSEPALRPSLAANSLIIAPVLGALGAGVVIALVAAFPAIGGHVSRVLLGITLATFPMFVLKSFLSLLLQADYHFTLYNVAWIISPLTTVVSNVLFAVLGILTVESATISWLVGQGLGLVIFLSAIQRRYGFGRPSLHLAKRTLSFGAKTHVGRFMSVGNYRADQWLMASMVGSHALGIYSIAVAWAETLFYVPGVVVLLQRPDLVRATPAEALQRAARVFRRAMVLSVVAAIGLIVAAPFLCVTVFGAKFAASVDQLRVLALSAVGITMLVLLSNAAIAQRRPLLSSYAQAAAVVATLVLDVLLIPHLAGLGASIATSAAYTIGGVCMAAMFLRAMNGRVADLVPRRDDVAWYVRKVRAMLPFPRPVRVSS